MSDAANTDSNMDHVDRKIMQLAALVDATIRYHCAGLKDDETWKNDHVHGFDEMDVNYINTWLRKEKDPLLVTILATLTGDRDPDVEESNDRDG